MSGILDFITAPFEAAAGWAWDTVIKGITNWLAKGFVQLVSFVWSVLDRSSTPHLDSEWYSGSAGAPYVTAVGVAAGVLGIVVLIALIHGVLMGRPMELVKRLLFDTPVAVAGILFTVGFAQIGIDLCDAISDGIWTMTRDKAVNAVDGLLLVSQKLSPASFLAPLVLGFGMIGMLMLWVTLLVREALIYLTVALCPLAWACSVWPALAPVRKRALELVAGLIVSKVAIALALAVGLGALGGVGATGNPGEGTINNGLAEFGTLVTGIIVFGLAAFMPFLVIKLVPVVETAVIAQGIQGAPVRAGMQGMQYSYYLQGMHTRLASGSRPGPAGSGMNSGVGGSEMAGMAEGGAGAASGGATGAAAAVAAPVAVVGAVASKTRDVVEHTAESFVDTSSAAEPPMTGAGPVDSVAGGSQPAADMGAPVEGIGDQP